MKTLAALVVVVLAVSTSAAAQTPCDLQGTWELVSAKYDNQPAPGTAAGLKIFTKSRFAVVGLDTKHRGPLYSAADLLSFYSTLAASAGPYTVSANTWTEKLEYFSDPAYLGLSVTFQCRQEGDRLVQTGTFPILSGGKRTGDIAVEEVWRRIERP